VGKQVATGFAALAGLSGFVSFLGWVLDLPALAGLGFENLPIFPWTALAYLFLAVGFIVAIQGNMRLARILWGFPLGIGLLGLFEALAQVNTGFGELLFPEQLARGHWPHPGRPGVTPSITLVLLSLAGYATRRKQWLHDEIGSLFAGIAFSLGAAAAVLVVLSLFSAGATPLNSLPGAIAGMCVAIAFITWNADFAWIRLISMNRAEWHSLRMMLPLVLLLPLVPTLLGLLIIPPALRPPLASQIAIVTGNVLIVALVVYGALVRIARGRSATAELAQALDTAIVVLTTPDGRILHWSRGCERLYGWTASEALGRNKYELLQSRTTRHGTPELSKREQELVEIRQDGHEVCVVERIQRIEARGRVPVLALSMSDVTQTAEAMNALRASEDRLAEAAAVQELGVFEWDVASGQFTWSPGTEQRLGVVPGSLNNYEDWARLVDPEDLKDITKILEEAVAAQSHKFRYHYRFRQPNGNVRAVEGSSRAFYDADGALVRTIGVIVDVTEREDREAALRRSEAQLRSVLDTVPDAMVAVDGDGIIRQFSPAAEALWGWRAEEVTGKELTILSAEERKPYVAMTAEAYEAVAGELITGIAAARDGREFPAEYRIGVANFDGDSLYIMFFRDISERVSAESRLGSLQLELAHVSRQSAMSELAADMAHELNQPLSATSNYLAAARMLAERGGEDGERLIELLRMGSEQTQRAGQIIRRLRDFTTRGEVEMRPEAIEPTLRDAVELVMIGTGQFHIRLNYDIDPETNTIYADRIQIQQVLVNLLRNSMDALRTMPQDDREITISTEPVNDNMIEIKVSDNGPGIPPNLLKELFSRFTSTKKPGAGMGIGLSISKRIIEAHGGTLTAENKPQGGAMFRFTLPTRPEGVDE
jgi:two-component system sensor kinase FixL